MVLEYAENGNLRKFLENNFNLTWNEKLRFLENIANNLRTIHNNNYVHKDLHSGNILQFNSGLFDARITDLGLAQFINNSKSSNSSSFCGDFLI
jgi:serine/threonine protein kinase